MEFKDLNKEKQHALLDDLAETLVGAMAMDSVVLDLINWIAEKFEITEFESYSDALDLIQQSNIVECDECPECGWFSEGNFYEHPDHDGVCSDCEVE